MNAGVRVPIENAAIIKNWVDLPSTNDLAEVSIVGVPSIDRGWIESIMSKDRSRSMKQTPGVAIGSLAGTSLFSVIGSHPACGGCWSGPGSPFNRSCRVSIRYPVQLVHR